MSLFILDTDILTLFQMNHTPVVQNVTARPASDIAISIITVEEQLGGWYSRLRKAKSPEELARVYQLLTRTVESVARFRILTFAEAAIRRQQDLVRQKLKVGKKDLGIAAIALEWNATVVTRNLQDFQRVPGLQVADWSK